MARVFFDFSKTIFSRGGYLLVTGVFLFLLNATVANAATITVGTLADTGVDAGCELREAIVAANTNAAGGGCSAGAAGSDTINFGVVGTIITASELPQIAEALIINGGGSITVSGNNTHRVLNLDATSLTLQNITIINGTTAFGGCLIANQGATMNFSSTTFDNCVATDDGGAIYMIDGPPSSSLTLTDVSFTNNSAGGFSGGPAVYLGNDDTLSATNLTATNNQSINGPGSVIYVGNFGGNTLLTIVGGSFTGNFGRTGGTIRIAGGTGHSVDNVTFDTNTCGTTFDQAFGCAIEMGNGDITITDSTFIDNAADISGGAGGGGALAAFGGTFNVIDSTFDNNTAQIGGAIRILGGNLNVTRSTFTSNDANNTGGAIDQEGGGALTITESFFGNNTTVYYGGALNLNGGGGSSGVVTNNTFEGNQAQYGGAIITLTTPADIFNNTFYQNSATLTSGGGGGGLYADNPTDVANNIFEDNTATLSGPDCQSDQVGDFNSLGANLVSDNTDCPTVGSDIVNVSANLGALQLNGGTTLNRMPNIGSAAINAANAAFAPAVDQRGVSRPFGAADDIGSVEVSDTTAPLIAEVTPVATPSTDTTPDYTFSSDEAGTIGYGGDCSSATVAAVVGNNTVGFNALAVGIHNNCTITVTDAALNVSNILNVSSFEITAPVPPPSPTPPPANSGGGGGSRDGCVFCGFSPSELEDLRNSQNDEEPSPSEPPTAPAPPPLPPQLNIIFTDFTSHWAKTYIQQLTVSCGITGYKDDQGNPLGLFKPDAAITRAELVTMLMKCKFGELIVGGTSPFRDLATDHWSAAYVAKAMEFGIVEGYEDGTFKPNQYVTRAEALKMVILTWFPLEDVNAAAHSDLCTDVPEGEWYELYFSFAISKSIVSGYKNAAGEFTGLCGPTNNVLRGEAAKMIVETRV